jgi:hypothetical protein
MDFALAFVMTICLSYTKVRLRIIKPAFIIREGFYYYKDYFSYAFQPFKGKNAV